MKKVQEQWRGDLPVSWPFLRLSIDRYIPAFTARPLIEPHYRRGRAVDTISFSGLSPKMIHQRRKNHKLRDDTFDQTTHRFQVISSR